MNDENVHVARALMDEVFGAKNFVAQITFVKASGFAGRFLPRPYDFLLWYAGDRALCEFSALYQPKSREAGTADNYNWLELPSGERRGLTRAEKADLSLLPLGARLYKADNITSQGNPVFPFSHKGKVYKQAWKTTKKGLAGLALKNRLHIAANSLQYVRYIDDFPCVPITQLWADTGTGSFLDAKLYSVQTASKVLQRCIAMTTSPGDIVFDPTCGSGTAAFCAEKLGRRWITCDTSRVAINVARQRLLGATFEQYLTRNGRVSGGFRYKTVGRVTLKSLAYDLEPEQVDLVDQPEVDEGAIRVCGPFEVMTLGRYSVEDWKGWVVRERPAGADGGAARLENYIETICRLYRRDAAVRGATGLVHAVGESEGEQIAVSVGPLSGRVTAKQINDAVQDALASGILEVHVLGWAFEANVGEVKSQLEKRGRVKVELIMIRPDTLAEGLRAVQPDMLFSPLALPEVEVKTRARRRGAPREAVVTLKGIALFDRKTRGTGYRQADSGYVAAWYLDEDYDGDCFVDCQMFFDFRKKPARKAFGFDVESHEFEFKVRSEPFPLRDHRRIAVKVVDVYGNESTIVKDLP